MPSPKRNRLLPYRNRQHSLRPILQPMPPTRPHATVPTRVSAAVDPTPVISQPSEPFRFLDLPGEIRNKIYDLVVPKARVTISGSHPQKELQRLKEQQPLRKHKMPRYRLSGKVTGDVTNTATALLLTCRQMNREVIEIVYAQTTFCFDRAVVLRKFMNVIPLAGRVSIENLEVKHVGYGEPQWMHDRLWKLRHDARWEMTLEQVKEQLTALKRLGLNIVFFDWPCRLETTESWARPLLMVAGDGLEQANVTLENDRIHPAKAAATAKELENMMMSTQGHKARRREAKLQAELEKKRKADSMRKATKVLTIRLPAGGASKTTTPVSKVVRRKGLEQYAVWEPPVAYC